MTAALLSPAPVPRELLNDPELPLGRVLLTEEVVEVLEVAVQPALLESARCHQVVCRFGESLSVSFECRLADKARKSDHRLLVVRAGREVPSTAVVLSDGTDRLAVWAFPDDPYLPGLAAVLDHRLSGLLEQLGVRDSVTRVEVRSYLPGRRAVVEADIGRTRLFIKAVRPHTVDRIQELQRLIGESLPLPRSIGFVKEMGLLVMEAMPGLTLSEHLARGGSGPDPRLVVELLDLLPGIEGGPQPLTRQVRNHARLLSLLAPDLADSLERMATIIEQVADEPLVPVHGDLHGGQIIIENRQPSGLIDVDRAGMGRRTDDLAGLLGQLTVSGQASVYLDRLWRAFGELVDPTCLRLKTAAAVLGFAPWSFVAQQPGWPEDVRRRINLAATLVADWLR